MLTKAILTGGVLSVLAGSIVYFGTEGADALESRDVESVRVEETELAGAPDVAVGDPAAKTAVVKAVRVEDAVVEDAVVDGPEPKTKWLDQYLKKAKPKQAADETTSEESLEVPSEMVSEPEDVLSMEDPASGLGDVVPEDTSAETSAEESTDSETAERKDKARMRMKQRKARKAARAEAKGRYIVSEDVRAEATEAEDDIDIQISRDETDLDGDRNVERRGVRKKGDVKSMPRKRMIGKPPTDYAPILVEAKKLLVTDMRNQAFLEIIDHAVDQGDVAQAADVVGELSTPELRDTARARIGTGLARSGDRDAAFAVLEEIEIDELTAPIRLEIITALMATKQERKNFGAQR